MAKKEKVKKERTKSTFWKDFKAFISRGNILDMAVGVIIGASFGKIVSGLVNYIFNPVIGQIIQTGALENWKTVLKAAELAEDGVTVATPEVAILWGNWLQTIIDFLITALCVFLFVRIFMKAKKKLEEIDLFEANKKKAAEEAEKKAAEEKAAEEKRLADEKAAQEQLAFRESIMNQEKYLAEIAEHLKNQAK